MKNPLHTLVRSFAQTRVGAMVFSKILHHIDNPVMKLTKGRTSVATLLAGLPTISLTTIGRKSGQPRTLPLLAVPDKDNLILIGSNFGGKKNPSWYYNLKANPEATVVLNGRSAQYLARQVQGAERQRCWELATSVYGGYANYEEWADHRDIPVMLLEPIK
jgi:deazaflavin-dependent oxidoreductase (nitroreductase family)